MPLPELQFIGLDNLKPLEQDMVRKLSAEYHEKIQREFQNMTTLKIHIKTYDDEGKRKKFSIHVQAIAPTAIVTSSKGKEIANWDLPQAVHQAFQNIEKQILHRFHSDTAYKKSYE